MKAIFLFGCLWLLLGCKKEEPPAAPVPPQKSFVELPDHFDEVWVMSSEWLGTMGVALAINDHHYFYWAYPDVGVNHSYPFFGTFRIEADEMILNSPRVFEVSGFSKTESPEVLYDHRWKIHHSGAKVILKSVNDLKNRPEPGRWLYPDSQFDPGAPFQNQSMLKPTD